MFACDYFALCDRVLSFWLIFLISNTPLNNIQSSLFYITNSLGTMTVIYREFMIKDIICSRFEIKILSSTHVQTSTRQPAFKDRKYAISLSMNDKVAVIISPERNQVFSMPFSKPDIICNAMNIDNRYIFLMLAGFLLLKYLSDWIICQCQKRASLAWNVSVNNKINSTFANNNANLT